MSTSGQSWRLTGSTLAFLRGSWQAERVLTDFRPEVAGSFRGVASFRPVPEPPGALAYLEHGELRFGRHQGPASRSLLLLPAPDGAAEVMFADQRPFYRLDLRSGYSQAEHLCGEDHYLVTVRVVGADCLTEHWRTRGPDKDYEMTTTLTRTGR